MAFEPKKITREHILQAVDRVKKENIELIPSTKWVVMINNEPFPPKDILRYAHEEMNGEQKWEIAGGSQTNIFLKAMDFPIVNKRMGSDPIEDMISKYKTVIKKIN